MKAKEKTITDWRLAAQLLGGSRMDTSGGVLERLVGVQAQDARGGKWSIGLRMKHPQQAVVDRALQESVVIHTWLMRGTLHYVAAADLGWLQALLAPGIIRRNASRYRQLSLDEAVFAKSQHVLRQALEAEGQQTRAEIKARFEQEGIPAEGQQMPYLLQRAALDGLIQVSQGNGNNPAYRLLPDLPVSQDTSDRTKTLGLLAARFFTSHGPATVHDFAWWSGLSMLEVRQASESAAGILAFEIDGVEYWAADRPPGVKDAETAALLPPFDEYLLGYKNRSLVLDPSHARKVNAGGGMFKPTAMCNGEIIGTWGYKLRSGRIEITIETFGEAGSKTKELLAHAAEHFGGFHGLHADVWFH